MNKLKHQLCYLCHKSMSVSAKAMYCRVYSLESGYLCDLCKKPYSTGYASKKPLPSRSSGANNRTKTVKKNQQKTTKRKVPEVPVKNMPSFDRSKVAKKIQDSGKMKKNCGTRSSNVGKVECSKNEFGGAQKILAKSKIVDDADGKLSFDLSDIRIREIMAKCVVRIKIDPFVLYKVQELENRLKVYKRSQNRPKKF